MNKISHSVKRIIIVLLVTIILCGIAGGVYYGIEGYKFYKEETEIKPVAEMLERIQSKESFTEYKDLPQIYIDAVISAEDKRFERHPGIDVLAICADSWYARFGRTIVVHNIKACAVEEIKCIL